MPKTIYRVPIGTKITEKETGYIRIKIKPGLWRREHCIIMEKKIGRKLMKGEQVHHINRVKDDNRLVNLSLCTNSSHHKLEYSGSGLEKYNKEKHVKNKKQFKVCKCCKKQFSKFDKEYKSSDKIWEKTKYCSIKCRNLDSKNWNHLSIKFNNYEKKKG